LINRVKQEREKEIKILRDGRDLVRKDAQVGI
jgi:hypothetical protein